MGILRPTSVRSETVRLAAGVAGTVVVIALIAALMTPTPAQASIAGWDVEWVQDQHPSSFMAVSDGKLAFTASSRERGPGRVALYDVETGKTEYVSDPAYRALYVDLEGDWLVWAGDTETSGVFDLFSYRISTGETELVATGLSDYLVKLTTGRVAWHQSEGETGLRVLDLAGGEETLLSQNAFGFPVHMNERWIVWSELDREPDYQEVTYAHDLSTGVAHELTFAPRIRPLGLLGDLLLYTERGPGLQLYDLGTETTTPVPDTAGDTVSNVATDETTGRIAWTAVVGGTAHASVYDLDTGEGESVPMPHHILGPIELAGDVALFRAQPWKSILAAPQVIFALDIDDGVLTELGQVLLPTFPFVTDGERVYWSQAVMDRQPPRTVPHFSNEWFRTASPELFIAAQPADPPTPFADVDPLGTPYRTAIDSLFELGAVSGYDIAAGRREFRPNQPYLRAQFAKVMVEGLDIPVDESLEAPFWDLGPDDPGTLYPHDYIAAAHDAGLIKGYANGAFRPWGPLRNAQLATMTVRAAASEWPGLLLETPAYYDSFLGHFDVTHAENVRIAQFNGLLNDVVGYSPMWIASSVGARWYPWGPATRKDGAQLLWNLLRTSLDVVATK